MTAEDSPAQDRSTARGGRGTAQPGFEPDQRLTGQLLPVLRRPVSSAVLPRQQASQPGDQPERYGVARFAGPQQVPQRRPGRPGALRSPVQDGAGEGVTGQRAQVRDTGDDRRVSRPGRGHWWRR